MFSRKSTLLFISLCIGLLVVTGCKKSEDENESAMDNNGKAAQAKEEIAEAVEATGEYLQEKKDAAVEKAQESYTSLKNNTQRLLSDVKDESGEKWQTMKTNLQDSMQNAEQKLQRLKDAGKDEMSDAQAAFNTAMRELKDAYEKTKQQYTSSDEQQNM